MFWELFKNFNASKTQPIITKKKKKKVQFAYRHLDK